MLIDVLPFTDASLDIRAPNDAALPSAGRTGRQAGSVGSRVDIPMRRRVPGARRIGRPIRL